MDLSALAAPFPAADIEWRVGSTTRDKSKGMALAYLTSRAVMQRLDDVCSPAGWRNEFRPGPDGGVVCGISVRVTHDDGTAEWVTKWDGSDATQVEAVKGGLSGAMKRAAVQWGVGRYLYDLPATWVRLDDRQRMAETPRIPPEFLPSGSAPSRQPQPAADRPKRKRERAEAPTLTPAQAEVAKAFKAAGFDRQQASNTLGNHGYEQISELPDDVARAISDDLAAVIAS